MADNDCGVLVSDGCLAASYFCRCFPDELGIVFALLAAYAAIAFIVIINILFKPGIDRITIACLLKRGIDIFTIAALAMLQFAARSQCVGMALCREGECSIPAERDKYADCPSDLIVSLYHGGNIISLRNNYGTIVRIFIFVVLINCEVCKFLCSAPHKEDSDQ